MTNTVFLNILGHLNIVFNVPNEETDLRTIIIETYDWAYIVVCKCFEFVITGYR